jgi:hypothetical protein
MSGLLHPEGPVKSIAIDLVSYINLADRKDREEHMKKSLLGCPVPFNRVDAIRLDAPPEAIGIRMKAEHWGSIGVSSIFLSHKKALGEARRRMTSGAFVLLEDDCRFPPSIWHSDLGLSRLPSSWEILMVSPRFRTIAEATGPKKRRSFWQRLNPRRESIWKRPIRDAGPVPLGPLRAEYVVSGAHFVLFKNAAVVSRVIGAMEAALEVYHVDHFYVAEFSTFGIDVSGVAGSGFGSDNRS